MTAHPFLLTLLVVFSAAAVMARNLLYSGVFLGLASVTLTLALYEMNAPWAALFELSVCAGLITVLFVSAVSLVRKSESFVAEDRVRFLALPFALGFFGLAFWLFSEPLSAALLPSPVVPAQASVGWIIWRARMFDVAGQLCLFAAGALAVNAFFKGKGNA